MKRREDKKKLREMRREEAKGIEDRSRDWVGLDGKRRSTADAIKESEVKNGRRRNSEVFWANLCI